MERKVSFYSDGVKIGGILFEPDGAPDNSCPGIVMCQGMAAAKHYYWYPHIARRFVELGCVALIWDYRGVEDSEGEVGRLYPQEQASDIRNALTYLQIHPKVDPERLALYGMSFGAGMVPYVAGIDERVKCAISAVGWGDGKRWMRSLRRHVEWLELLDRVANDRRSRVLTGRSEILLPSEVLPRDPSSVDEAQAAVKKIEGMESYQGTPYSLASIEKIMEFKPKDVVHQISPRAILYIATEKDTITPADDVIDMYERTREPKKLWVIPGAPHYVVYEEPYWSQILEMTTDWLRQHLPLN